MNDLPILIRFFRFLQQSMIRTRSNASKLVLRLPGSKILSFAYGHLKPSPTVDDQEKKLLEEFVLILTSVLQSLLELHPHCWEQIDSTGLFDRLERYNQQQSVRIYSAKEKLSQMIFVFRILRLNWPLQHFFPLAIDFVNN